MTTTSTPDPALTVRERQVLAGIGRGQKYSEVAFDLGVGYDTVKAYAARLRAKLGVSGRAGLILWAVQHPEATANVDAIKNGR